MLKVRGWNRSLAALSFAVACAMANAAGEISSVEVAKVGEGVQVKVVGSGLKKPVTSRAWKNEAFILSFSAKMVVNGKRTPLDHAGVKYVQYTQFTTRPLVSRVVLRMRPTDTPKITEVEDGWLISVNADALSNSTPTGPDTASKVVPLGENPTLPSVSHGTKTAVLSDVFTAATVTQPMSKPASPVSLNFDDADVVQILKALALQAKINVVTAPEVKGNISVALNNVSVDHALGVVTALAGLRYQKVDNTIIVASAERLPSIVQGVRAASSQGGTATESRIVPLYSRQGRQVKSAIYRILSQENISGRYELVLPSETVPGIVPASTPDTVLDPKAGQGGTPPTQGGTAVTAGGGVDEYVMIIATPRRLDEVEQSIRALDKQISDAIGIETPSTSAPVQETYLVKGTTAGQLLNALGAKDGKFGNVNVVATPNESSSRQTIVLSGRESDVKRAMSILGELDGDDVLDSTFVLYDVKHADPRALRDALILQVPGVRAIIPPNGVGNTRTYQPITNEQVNQAKQGGDAAGAGKDDQNQSNAGAAAQVGLPQGLGQPYQGFETVGVPMRLVLRGSDNALQQATKLLAMLDKEPAQIAMELRVMELTKEDAKRVGIDWNIFTGGAVKFIRLNNRIDNPNNTIGGTITDKNFSGDVVGMLDGIANKSNLIARPNMVAYDGRESELFIGDVIRYVESVISSQNGPSVTIKELRVGVNLAVFPRISESGTATLDLRPTVSSLKGFTRVNLTGFSAELPQTAETITQNTIQVKDGETIAIGGLINEQMTTQSKGVPLLMDLPVLGQFFRSTVTSKTRRELVIFITTRRIVGPLGSDDISKLPAVNEIKTRVDTSKEKRKP